MAKKHPPPPWFKLSDTLTGPKSPDRCQSCGAAGEPDSRDITRWQECDHSDRPTAVVVVLCKPCGGRLIEPHPRLYRALEPNDPHPGSNGVCLDCPHRAGVNCGHPDAKANGGAGVLLAVGKPTEVHLCRSPRRLSGWVRMWPYPPRDCKQKHQPKPPETTP